MSVDSGEREGVTADVNAELNTERKETTWDLLVAAAVVVAAHARGQCHQRQVDALNDAMTAFGEAHGLQHGGHDGQG